MMMLPALADRSQSMTRRLADEFVLLSAEAVERCVADVCVCVEHLGVDATPALVEKIAREHLVGMVKSRPPSAD
jgi:hypothetical protein